MKEVVKLFIGGKEVQFKTAPEILYNYTETDLQNPTIVKNSYSKTITIEGTPENNKIFGQFWDLERVQTSANFNPSQKTPFVLYVNGEICESGYAKLDEVVKKKEGIQYNITLYGGLGEFFYLLSYSENGDKLKLSDLEYTVSGGDDEFNFTINKETLNEAWNSLSATTGTKWDIINFAPCYNGNPDGLSADKVLINFNNNILPSSTTEEGVTYTARQGYALGTLPADVDEWVVRDLRSWNQRPAIKMKEIIKACERYAAKSGYSIDYDTSFFKTDNPYWNNAWLTLPKLDEIKIQGESDTPSYTFTPTLGSVMTVNGWYNTTWMLNAGNIPLGTEQIKIDMTPILNVSDYSRHYYTPISGDTLYSSAYINGVKNFNGFLIQLVAYDGANFNSNVVAASDAVFITSKLANGEFLDISAQDFNLNNFIVLNKNYSNVFGNYTPIGNGNYSFGSQISLVLDNTNKAASYAIKITCIANTTMVSTSQGTAYTFGSRRGNFFNATTLNSMIKSGDTVNTIELRSSRDVFVTQATGTTYAGTDTAGYSGAKLTKKLLLDTENSPCDYLLSYTKLFGLYFVKNPYDKIIHIMTRDNFYRTGTTINLEYEIDRGSDNKVTPIAFDSKWYDMQLENVDGECAQKYKTTYGRNYGIQRINTGYNFDNNSTDLYKDSAFKGAVECTEKSRYYIAPMDTQGYFDVPYYYTQGMTYLLYDASGNTCNDITPSGISGSAQPMKERKYYDAFSKVQLREADYKAIDGQNVLLFYNGIVEHKNESNKVVTYFLTDDLPIMGLLNDGQACWLSTESIYASGGTQIAIAKNAIPEFGRYINRDDYLLNSFDFGSPKELFIPDAVLRENSSLYYNYWQRYITDLYDVNTKLIECPVLLNGKPTAEWLRDFYWFDNSIWRINKITDWRIGTDEPTKVQFIKVQDKQNYTLTPVAEINPITLSVNKEYIPLTGGSVTFTVQASASTHWFSTSAWEPITTAFSGTGNSTFTVQIPAYTGGQRNEINLSLIGDMGQYSNTITITQMQASIQIQVLEPSGNIDRTGGTINCLVKTELPWSASATAYATPVINTGSGNNEWQSLSFTIGQNYMSSARSFRIAVDNGTNVEYTPYIYQNGGESAAASFNPTGLTFTSSATTTAVTITSNVNWRLGNTYDWITSDIVSGTSGTTTINLTCSGNTSESRRTGYLTIKDMINNKINVLDLTVVQEGTIPFTPSASFSFTSITSPASPTYYNLTIQSNVPWRIKDSTDWIRISPTAGSPNVTSYIAVSLFQNSTGSQRHTQVFIYNAETDEIISSQPLNIYQNNT